MLLPSRSLYALQMNGRVAWVLQELPSFLIPVLLVQRNGLPTSLPARLLLGMFLIHYTHRTFIFPLRVCHVMPCDAM